jgi:hypothetical protein
VLAPQAGGSRAAMGPGVRQHQGPCRGWTTFQQGILLMASLASRGLLCLCRGSARGSLVGALVFLLISLSISSALSENNSTGGTY